MPEPATLASFALIAVAMVLTPGPNMIYLVSRSIAQGRRAGMISLLGVGAGFLAYMLCAAFGITALLAAQPLALMALRGAGAAYLLYLAFGAVRGAAGPFGLRDLPPDSGARLFAMGLMTNLLNPKIAVLYLSLLPQFVQIGHGSVLAQTLTLGLVQIAISLAVNGVIIAFAAQIAGFLARAPFWAAVQRWIMAGALGALALRMLAEARR